MQELIITGYCGSLLSRVVGLKHPFRNPSDILVQSRRLLARLIALFRNDQSAISDPLSSRGRRTAAIRGIKAASDIQHRIMNRTTWIRRVNRIITISNQTSVLAALICKTRLQNNEYRKMTTNFH